jgi:hypothetical protein
MQPIEILAYISIALTIIGVGIALTKFLYRHHDFQVFTLTSISAATLSVVAWVLAYFLYEPGTAAQLWIEIAAGAFVFLLGVVLPFWLLIQNIRGTNLFWGLLAFIYQLLVVSTLVLLLLMLILRLMDTD